MQNTKQLLVPHSVLLIMDYEGGEIPLSMDKLVVANPTCIAIATQSPVDGEIQITLTDQPAVPISTDNLFKEFEGQLHTPQSKVSIWTTELELLLEMPVTTRNTFIEVWLDSTYPKRIVVRAI